MTFLELFDDDQKTAFRAVSTAIDLERGAYLMRRGDPGGDVFLLEEGTVEIVDSRATPEAILAIIESGSVVGEIAFLDDSPRSADARAATSCRARRWAKEDLRKLLHQQPALAARFYEGVARVASTRMRSINTTAVAGLSARDGALRAGGERTRTEALALADRTKEALLAAEASLRQDPSDQGSRVALRTALDTLQAAVADLFQAQPDADLNQEAARLLTRELHPYLVRSALAERSVRRSQGVTGTAEVLAHVLVDTPGGDGPLGQLIDRWLLDRPSLAALRQVGPTITPLVAGLLPDDRPRRVLVCNAGTGALIAALGVAVGDHHTVVTVVDQSRDTLGFLDAGVTTRPRKVQLQTVQENLVQFALGRSRHQFPPQDAVVLHGLLEFMPDRLVLSLLSEARRRLAPEGRIVFSALQPSPDHYVLDRLLAWPTVRRRRDRMVRLVQRAGLRVHDDVPTQEPLMVLAVGPA